MKKIVLGIFISLIIIEVNAQIITEIRLGVSSKKSLKNTISKFLFVNENYPVDYGFDTYNVLTDTFYRRSNLTVLTSHKYLILEILIGKIPSYTHLLIKNNQTAYLVNMRNPLDSILNQVISISDFSKEFKDDCCKAIKRTHRHNWNKNHSVQQYYIDEEGFFQPILYDPKDW